jgi:hypothetical protein
MASVCSAQIANIASPAAPEEDEAGEAAEVGEGRGPRGRGRKRKRGAEAGDGAGAEVAVPLDNDLALPPLESNIRRWAYAEEYNFADAGRLCPGCEIIERRHAFVTAVDETRRRFESGLLNVARSLTCAAVRALSADYQQWADQERARRALLASARAAVTCEPAGPIVVHNMPDEKFIDQWPDWQIIHHLFAHPTKLLFRKTVRECLLRKHLDYAMLYEMRRPTLNTETGVVSVSPILPATMAAVQKGVPLLRTLQEDISKEEQQLDADNGKASNIFAGTHVHGLFDLMGTIAF